MGGSYSEELKELYKSERVEASPGKGDLTGNIRNLDA